MTIRLIISCAIVILTAWLLSKILKSGVCAIAVFILLSVTILLNVTWAAINSITNQGINLAALYHMWSGTSGAGYADYHLVIIIAVAVAIITKCVIGLMVFRRKTDGWRSNGLQWVALALGILGLCFSPGMADIYRASRLGSESRSDFASVYKLPYIESIDSTPPQNLIYIYAEGLERTYFDESIFPGLITELRKLEDQAISFTEITQVDGTGWTIAGIVASQCGIPLLVPAGAWAGNSMSGMDAFLPGAKGLGALLKAKGYYLSFMGGADIKFAGKDKFFKTHQFDEILGREELLPQVGQKDYINSWGLYDDTLFELAQKKVKDLSRAQRPFALFLMTLETHPPYGNKSRAVADIRYGDGSDQMLSSIAGSDMLIARLIREIRDSPAGANTVIVLASDHLAHNSTATARMGTVKRRNLFMVFPPGSASGADINTEGSTLDIAATLLPFIGFRGAVGLGSDLRDMSVDISVRRKIMEGCNHGAWNSEIMAFWDFPRLVGRIEINLEGKHIIIGNRSFKIPALLTLSEDGTAKFSFEFDSPEGYLARPVEDKMSKSPFILLTTRQKAPSLLGAEDGDANAWFLIAGSAGEIYRITRIDQTSSFAGAELIQSTQIGAPRHVPPPFQRGH